MSLQSLIDNQTLRIDDHKRGTKEVKDLDDPAVDVHIDKLTKWKIDGKRQMVHF